MSSCLEGALCSIRFVTIIICGCMCLSACLPDALCVCDFRNAGTDCRVFLQLSGEGCTGPPMELQAAGGQLVAAASFQRGCVDGFTLQLPVLGPLRSATVWMEGCASPWHLDLIAVTGPQGKL